VKRDEARAKLIYLLAKIAYLAEYHAMEDVSEMPSLEDTPLPNASFDEFGKRYADEILDALNITDAPAQSELVEVRRIDNERAAPRVDVVSSIAKARQAFGLLKVNEPYHAAVFGPMLDVLEELANAHSAADELARRESEPRQYTYEDARAGMLRGEIWEHKESHDSCWYRTAMFDRATFYVSEPTSEWVTNISSDRLCKAQWRPSPASP
jgi:hypothetical protein